MDNAPVHRIARRLSYPAVQTVAAGVVETVRTAPSGVVVTSEFAYAHHNARESFAERIPVEDAAALFWNPEQESPFLLRV